MDSIIVTLSPSLSAQTVVRRFETMIVEAGLVVHTRGGLATKPGSTHWHIRKEGENGTLEATWLPATGHFSFSIHENRQGDWIAEAVKVLRKRLEECS
ncbi:hypothetical protein KQH82_07420 [bacterium]|nr:hypothetical protein [bacterium]